VGQRIRRDRPAFEASAAALTATTASSSSLNRSRDRRAAKTRAQLGHQVIEVQGLRTRPGRRDQRDLAL
jgi:hypothetical protein